MTVMRSYQSGSVRLELAISIASAILTIACLLAYLLRILDRSFFGAASVCFLSIFLTAIVSVVVARTQERKRMKGPRAAPATGATSAVAG